MSMKRVNQGLSLLMTLLLCATSFNFSMLAQAKEVNARIIGFNQLDESIASQNLPVGASLDEVTRPDSLKATVETVEEVEVRKAVEQINTSDEEKEEETNLDDAVPEVEEPDEASSSSELIQSEPAEDTSDEVDVVEDESSDSNEADVIDENAPSENPVDTEESAPSESENNEEVEKESTIISFINFLFPALVAKATDIEESDPSPLAGATEAVSQLIPETEYETVIETQTIQSEITIENVTWQIAGGAQFDSSNESTYIFEPVFTTDYVIDALVPTITVRIGNEAENGAAIKADQITVTFKVVNGSWDDGTTEDKTVTLTETAEPKLTSDQIPAVGSKPIDSKYKSGSWDMIPSTDSVITDAITYTYTYEAKQAAVVVKAPEAKKLIYVDKPQ